LSLKLQLIGNLHCHLSEVTELKFTSLIKMIILEGNFKWHFCIWTLHIQYMAYSSCYWVRTTFWPNWAPI